MNLSRQEVVARLQLQLKAAETADAHALAEHRKAVTNHKRERKAWAKEMTAAITKDDEEAIAELMSYNRRNVVESVPSCPLALAPKVMKQIDIVNLIRDDFIVTSKDSALMAVLSAEYGPAKRVC